MVKKWHYLAVKSLFALLRGITSNDNGDFYCMNCLLSFRTEHKLKKYKKVCENFDYCYVEIPIIYADLESLLEKKTYILWLFIIYTLFI